MRYWIDMHCDTLSELFLAEHGETVGKNLSLCRCGTDAADEHAGRVFCLFCRNTRWRMGCRV